MKVRADLSIDELAILVGLVRLVLHADDEISPAEQDALSDLQAAIGEERWNEAVALSVGRFQTDEQLFSFASHVHRQARWPLLAALTDLAGSDGIEAVEASVLGRILRAWSDDRVAEISPQP